MGVPDGAGGPGILGVLNASPESFSGNRVVAGDAADTAARLVADGAAVLDIGAQSLRTDRPELSTSEEIGRLLPTVAAVRDRLPDVPISIDTYRAEVAAAALGFGVQVINDPSGLHDEAIGDLVVGTDRSLVLAYNPGPPKVRRPQDVRADDPVQACCRFLAERIDRLTCRGVRTDQLILDPGPDLFKPPDQTMTILRAVPRIRAELGIRRVLWALSRKDFIGALLEVPPRERGAGTLGALAAVDLHDGDLIRVHDVRATADFLTVRAALLDGAEPTLALRDDLRYDGT